MCRQLGGHSCCFPYEGNEPYLADRKGSYPRFIAGAPDLCARHKLHHQHPPCSRRIVPVQDTQEEFTVLQGRLCFHDLKKDLQEK